MALLIAGLCAGRSWRAASAGLAVCSLLVAASCHLVIGYEEGHPEDTTVPPVPPAACELGTSFFHVYGDDSDQPSLLAASGPDGDAALGGAFQGSIDFGNEQTIGPSDGIDAFTAKLDSGGATIFANAVKGSDATIGQTSSDVAVTPSGGVAVVGSFDGTPLTATAPTDGIDGFVSLLGPQGMSQWMGVPMMRGAGDQWARAVAIVTPVVAVGGGFRGELLTGMGAGMETSDSGAALWAYVAWYTASNGAHDHTVVLSWIEDEAQVDDLLLRDENTAIVALGGAQGGVSALTRDDTELWTNHLGSMHGVALAAEGPLYAVGELEGELTIAGQTLASAGGKDALIAALDPDSGEVLWAQRIGGELDDLGADVTIGCDGRVIVALTVRGDVQLGDLESEGDDDADILIVRLDPSSGAIVSFERHGGPEDQIAMSIDAGEGAPILGGVFAGSIAFGDEETASAGGLDAFVARVPLAPAGEPTPE